MLPTERLAKQKLAAFERLQPEFEASFRFVQDVHGQRRFSAFPVIETVHYLHALWVCECKDRLLSIYRNTVRYEGHYCLDLLRRWYVLYIMMGLHSCKMYLDNQKFSGE
jgi:hypothetical protein